MEERRGRPKNFHEENIPRQFSQTFKDDDAGIISIWHYDLDINPNGPIETINEYPKNYETPLEELDKTQKDLPLTKRKFLNPKNGKYVGYQRAKILKLI